MTADIRAVFNDRKFKIMIRSQDSQRCVLSDLHIVADTFRMQDHSAMMPDTDAPTKLHRVWQTDPARPFHKPIRQLVGHAERDSQQFWANPHPPVTEAVHGNRPESLFEPVSVVCSEVFAEQRKQSDFGGIPIDGTVAVGRNRD